MRDVVLMLRGLLLLNLGRYGPGPGLRPGKATKSELENHHVWIATGLVNKQFAIENGPVDIVDLPSYKMGGFSIAMWLFTKG